MTLITRIEKLKKKFVSIDTLDLKYPKLFDDVLQFLYESEGYLQAAETGSMSRNNSENLTGELLELLHKKEN